MKYSILFTLLCFNITAVLADGTTSEDGFVWIDVRTPAEYETGHFPGARNINFDEIGTRISEITQDKGAPIVLYCKSGRRSGFAKQALEELGYSNIVNAGGISEVLRLTRREPETGPDCAVREC